jgi:methionine-gamma-lyase
VKPFLSLPGPWLVAHRGGAGLAPENTLAAFDRGVALGADCLELDVRRTRDGEVVIFHDRDTTRITGVPGRVEELRFAGLAGLDAGHSFTPDGGATFPFRDQGLGIPRLAELLERHPAVARVSYPGLPSFPQAALVRRQMSRPGALIACELAGGMAAGLDFMNRLELVTRAVSLGDAETLVQHPASMTHATYTPAERAAHGIGDGLIRLSIGLENLPDLVDDITQSLDGVVKA